MTVLGDGLQDNLQDKTSHFPTSYSWSWCLITAIATLIKTVVLPRYLKTENQASQHLYEPWSMLLKSGSMAKPECQSLS